MTSFGLGRASRPYRASRKLGFVGLEANANPLVRAQGVTGDSADLSDEGLQMVLALQSEAGLPSICTQFATVSKGFIRVS